MKNSFFLTASLILSCFVSLAAQAQERYRLSQPLEVRTMYRGVLEQSMELPTGTILEIDSFENIGRARYVTQNGQILTSRRGWVRVHNIELNRQPRYGSELEYGMDRFLRRTSREAYYVSEAIDQLGVRLGRVTRYEPIPQPRVQDRVVVRDTSFNSYEACYTQPRTQWVTMNQRQRSNGNRNALIGTGLAIGGLILSGSNDNGVRDLGRVVAVGGAALAVVGLVQVSNSQSPVTVYDTRCEQYYVRDTQVRTVYIENQRCSTERYYSRSWDREVEYFQTTCSGNRYYSFERNSQIW